MYRRLVLKWAAVVIAVVAFLLAFFRFVYVPIISDFFDLFTDKIADGMSLPTDNEKRIYAAALERLERKFPQGQARLLASLMVAQSKYETANYTSNVFKKNNNAFGYKYYKGSLYQNGFGLVAPSKDAQGNPDGGSYAKYSDVADSAREVADWIGRRKESFINVSNPLTFAAALKNNDYFGQTAYQYYQGVQKYYV